MIQAGSGPVYAVRAQCGQKNAGRVYRISHAMYHFLSSFPLYIPVVSLCQIHLGRPLIIHISEAPSADTAYQLSAFLIFSGDSAPQHGPKIMNEQKNTKLCQVYSHISSYKWVYFSITPGPFPVTPQLQRLRNCSSFTISELAGHWVSYPCVLWLLHTPLRSNSTTKRLLQKTLSPASETLPGVGRLHAPAGLVNGRHTTKIHQTLPAI